MCLSNVNNLTHYIAFELKVTMKIIRTKIAKKKGAPRQCKHCKQFLDKWD